MTLTIEIEDTKRKSLEKIATEKGKQVSEFVIGELNNTDCEEIEKLLLSFFKS